MVVCIAEKPSVARDIARIIGATASHDGYMEGNGYQVTWTYGHLCTLKEPGDYTPAWRPWALTQLPMIPPRFGIKLINEDHITKQFAIIERLMQAADGIVNCGDAGQEGELIQRWVMQKAQAKCPVKRLWISSMTDEAIREGFANLKDQQNYQPLYMAGMSRAIGDWLLGMNATRLYTLKYGQNRQVLSIGRVQTPTLALIVNRQKEIDNFKPEPYWVLATVYRDTTFTATSGKFTSKEEGEKAFALIEGKPFTVTKVEKKEGKEQPPQLYDLTSLQVDCNRKFGFSAEMTLNLIQSLYEKKFTTYPRVDTQYLSDDIYAKCPQTLNGLYQTKFTGVAPYAELIKPIGGKTLKKSKRVFDTSKVTDHHAIIPTGIVPQALSDAERKVFDLVARRFIGVFLPDCKFSTTTVLGEVAPSNLPQLGKASDAVVPPPVGGGQGEAPIEFKVTGKEIIDPGWRVVLDKEKPKTEDEEPQDTSLTSHLSLLTSEKDEERTLPTFVKGESGDHKPTLTEKWTTPPPYYNEASLLRAMETAGKFVEDEELRAAMKENGIGRPSSRAGIIETLFKRHYIKRDRKRLIATPTGIELIDLIREELLKSCELTGIWEKKLRDIEHQKYDAQQFIDELKAQVTEIVQEVMQDNSNRRVTVLSDAEIKKVKASPRSAEGRLQGKNPSKKKGGKDKTASPLPSEELEDTLVGTPCPLCGKGHIIKGKTAYGCSEWKNGCTWRKPFVQ